MEQYNIKTTRSSAILTYMLQWYPDVPGRTGRGLIFGQFPGAWNTRPSRLPSRTGTNQSCQCGQQLKLTLRQCKHDCWMQLTPHSRATPAPHVALHLLFQWTSFRDTGTWINKSYFELAPSETNIVLFGSLLTFRRFSAEKKNWEYRRTDSSSLTLCQPCLFDKGERCLNFKSSKPDVISTNKLMVSLFPDWYCNIQSFLLATPPPCDMRHECLLASSMKVKTWKFFSMVETPHCPNVWKEDTLWS